MVRVNESDVTIILGDQAKQQLLLYVDFCQVDGIQLIPSLCHGVTQRRQLLTLVKV
jgi:hypothetical protein